MEAVYTLPWTLGNSCLVVRMGKSFLKLFQVNTTSGSNTIFTAPNGAQHFTQVAWCCRHPLGPVVYHRWAETCLDPWVRFNFGQLPDDQRCCSTSCGPTTYTARTQLGFCQLHHAFKVCQCTHKLAVCITALSCFWLIKTNRISTLDLHSDSLSIFLTWLGYSLHHVIGVWGSFT